jgi:hypothetical protein
MSATTGLQSDPRQYPSLRNDQHRRNVIFFLTQHPDKRFGYAQQPERTEQDQTSVEKQQISQMVPKGFTPSPQSTNGLGLNF